MRYDIRIDTAYINANNDIEWFVSDMAHIQDAIEASPGQWKEHPTDGVAIVNYLNSAGQEQTVARKVIIELQKDLYQCNNPLVTYTSDGTLNVNPNIEL
jgi:predicted metal-binding protein